LHVSTAENFPTTSRTTATGICSAFSRAGGVVSAIIGHVLIVHSAVVPAIIFGVAVLIAGVLGWLLPHETLNVDLEDVSNEATTRHQDFKSIGIEESLVPMSPEESTHDLVHMYVYVSEPKKI
jgi:MFS family permease